MSGDVARVEALLDIGRFDQAASRAAELLTDEPDDMRRWCLLAQARLGAGDPANALEAAKQAVTRAPDDEWPHRLASIALRRLGRHYEAFLGAQESVRCAPYDWRCHQALALAAADARHHEVAEAAADEAVRLAPGQAEAHAASGYAALAARRYADAEVACQRALEIDPANSESLNNLAVVRLRTKRRLRQAMEGLHAAVATDPAMDVARQNIDGLLVAVLVRAQWLVLVAAVVLCRFGLAADLAGMSRPVLTAAAGAAALVAVGGSAWSLRRIPRQLWPYAIAHVRSTSGLRSCGASALAVVLLCVAPLLPGTAIGYALVVAAVSAWVGMRLGRRARRRPA